MRRASVLSRRNVLLQVRRSSSDESQPQWRLAFFLLWHFHSLIHEGESRAGKFPFCVGAENSLTAFVKRNSFLAGNPQTGNGDVHDQEI